MLYIDVIHMFAKFYTHKLHFDEVMAINILTVISYLDPMFVLECTLKNRIYIAKIVHQFVKMQPACIKFGKSMQNIYF